MWKKRPNYLLCLSAGGVWSLSFFPAPRMFSDSSSSGMLQASHSERIVPTLCRTLYLTCILRQFFKEPVFSLSLGRILLSGSVTRTHVFLQTTPSFLFYKHEELGWIMWPTPTDSSSWSGIWTRAGRHQKLCSTLLCFTTASCSYVMFNHKSTQNILLRNS